MLFGGMIERDRSGLPRKEEMVSRESDWVFQPEAGEPVRIVERGIMKGFEYIITVGHESMSGYVRIPDGTAEWKISSVIEDSNLRLNLGVTDGIDGFPVDGRFLVFRDGGFGISWNSYETVFSAERVAGVCEMITDSMAESGICCSEG